MDDRLGSDLASLRIDRKAPAPSSGRAVRWAAGLVIVVAVAIAAWKIGAPAVEARVFKTVDAAPQEWFGHVRLYGTG